MAQNKGEKIKGKLTCQTSAWLSFYRLFLWLVQVLEVVQVIFLSNLKNRIVSGFKVRVRNSWETIAHMEKK